MPSGFINENMKIHDQIRLESWEKTMKDLALFAEESHIHSEDDKKSLMTFKQIDLFNLDSSVDNGFERGKAPL